MIPEYGQSAVKNITDGLRKREFSAVELCRDALSAAYDNGRNLNAFITITEDAALSQAAAIDNKIASGEEPGVLAGVPVAVKDNICYHNYPTTCGSKILEKFIPPYDATCLRRLIDADAVIVGKTNMDEFAMGSSNETSYFGPVSNPHGAEFVPGGSSGGSAAVVAAGITPLALGSDTGGSVRQPAALCGVYGLKPTYGAVSRYGLVAFASSMDQIGPMAGSVDDLAKLFTVIGGYDEHDATSAKHNYDDLAADIETDRKFRIGLPEDFLKGGIDAEVAAVFERAKARLVDDGHRIVGIDLPHLKDAIAVYYVIANAEASSNLARYDGVGYGLRVDDEDLTAMIRRTRSEGFGREVKRRIILGTHVLSAGYYDEYYNRAFAIRRLIRRDFEAAFDRVDLIMTPTTPTAAFKLGEKIDSPLEMYLSDIFTVPANLAGIPAVSVPFGTVGDSRPVGVQFMARRFDEQALFRIARRMELMRNE